MSKLYIFGIGGTGSRVLRSLTMLMAAGVRINTDTVVPVIIDPDDANADLTRTVEIMNLYRSIRQDIGPENNSSFFVPALEKTHANYQIGFKGTKDLPFYQFLGCSNMSKENKALADMLFSQDNMKAEMNHGFRGNPNIGSVVLNQIMESDEFRHFASNFQQGDRIFIISSIFGGTGAAGFPLLLKTLRNSRNFANSALINNAPIGALTILPYFDLDAPDEMEKKDLLAAHKIDSSTFIAKAKSALAYYEHNISSNNEIDALYFLADALKGHYENHDGGDTQRNDAHLIEFLGAMAVINFANNITERQPDTVNMEFGVKNDAYNACITFDSFSTMDYHSLYNPLVRFTLFCNTVLDYSGLQDKSFAANSGFDGIYGTYFFGNLHGFFSLYRQWLDELRRNRRSLNLFNLECGGSPFELVIGVRPKKVLSNKSNYSLVIDRLNSAAAKCTSKKPEARYMEMFHRGTETLIKEKLSR